jgi:uncharacterized protein YqgC (DUF456 family)
MISLVTALRWVARLDGLAALILGGLLWSGSDGQLKIHILTGFIMTITLLLLGLFGFFARIKPVLPIIAIIWAILLPYIGFAQLHLLPGASHVVIQVVHLLIGVCAIGVAEAVGAKITKAAKA